MGFTKDVTMRLRLLDQGFRGNLQKAGGQMKEFGSSMKDRLSGIIPAWAGVAGAIYAVQAALRSGIAAASEWEDAQTRMEVISRGNIQTLDKMKKMVDSNAGGLFSRTDVASAVNYAQAVGFNIQNTEKLLPLLRDTAAVYGQDLTTAMMGVVKAIKMGDAELAERMGLTLRDIAVQDVSIKMYGKKIEKLTAAEKESVKLAAAIEQLSRTTGWQERATETLSGATKKLATNWGELTADGLEPTVGVLTKIASGLGDVLGKVRELNQEAKNAARTRADREGGAMGEADPASAIMQSSVNAATEALIGAAPKAVGEKAKFDLIAYFQAMADDPMLGAHARKVLSALLPPEDTAAAVAEAVALTDSQLKDAIDRLRGGRGDEKPDFEQASGTEYIDERLTSLSAYEAGLERVANTEAIVNQARMDQWEKYGAFATATMQGVVAGTSTVMQAVFLKEVKLSKMGALLLKQMGRQMTANVLEELGARAEKKATFYALEALAYLAMGNFPGAAKMGAAAAGMGMLAGTLNAAAGAITVGGQREMAAATGKDDYSMSGYDTGTGYGSAGGGTSRRDLVASISRAPETVNIHVSNIFEGPNIIGGDESALRVFYEDHIQKWVAEDTRMEAA